MHLCNHRPYSLQSIRIGINVQNLFFYTKLSNLSSHMDCSHITKFVSCCDRHNFVNKNHSILEVTEIHIRYRGLPHFLVVETTGFSKS